jgi:coatomer protein complex subunit epsilon
LRAQLALGKAAEVLAEINNDDQVADLAAVKALALYQSGKEAQGLKLAETLATEQTDNSTVQLLAGTVLENAGRSEEALALLSGHQGSLEA